MDKLSKLGLVIDKLNKKTFPHGSNIRTKLSSTSLSSSQRSILNQIAPAYLSIIASSHKTVIDFDEWLGEHTLLVNDYIETLRSCVGRAFSHQSDFISSVIPEYLCCVLKKLVEIVKLPLDVEGQTDLIIELVFSPSEHGKLFSKFKRVDAAVLVPSCLKFRDEDVTQFKIPVIAVEVKTNLDKNMLAGIDSSVSALKNTFPLCKYFVISEFSDFQFENQNYANSDIDEVYILRRQKRSEFRHTGKANSISLDVTKDFVKEAMDGLALVKSTMPDITHRMSKGRLIGWR